MRTTSSVGSGSHGARPVPLRGAGSAFTAVPPQTTADDLRAASVPKTALPTEQASLLEMARRPVGARATVAVVGHDGGAGRTRITRLLGEAYHTVRAECAVGVDAVPLWGGLTAAVHRRGALTVHDMAAMPWPRPVGDPPAAMLHHGLSSAGPLPVLPGGLPAEGPPTSPAAVIEATRRIASFAQLTIVDTVADPAASPTQDLILDPRVVLVWVARASRAGLWGIGDVLSYFQHTDASNVIDRSVVVAVGPRRRWPADAAAVATQMAGHGIEVIRMPTAARARGDRRCAAAALHLLAAIVTRLGDR